MKLPLTFSSRAARCFGALAGLLAAGLPLASALAQAPNPTAVFPARNATRVLTTVSPVLGFDKNMSGGASTLGSVEVFSQQHGGRMQHAAGGTTTGTNTSGGGGLSLLRRVVGGGGTTTPTGGGVATSVVDPRGGGGGGSTPTDADQVAQSVNDYTGTKRRTTRRPALAAQPTTAGAGSTRALVVPRGPAVGVSAVRTGATARHPTVE